MIVTIAGIQKGTSKNGRNFTNIFAQKEFTDYEKSNSVCEGVSTFNEFTYNDYPIKPGDRCEFVYEPGYQGRATLVDVKILKENAKQ